LLSCTGAGAGFFWEVQRIFCPSFLKKLLCDKPFPYKFSVTVGTFYFNLAYCHRLENRKFGTWYLVRNNPTEKRTLGCAKALSEVSLFSTLSISLTVMRLVAPFTYNCCCQQENLITSTAEDIYVRCKKGCRINNSSITEKFRG